MQTDDHNSAMALYKKVKLAFETKNNKEKKELEKQYSKDKYTFEDFFSVFVCESQSARFLDYIMKDLPDRDKIVGATPIIAAVFNNLPILRRLSQKYNILHRDTLRFAFRDSSPKMIDYLLTGNKELYALNEELGYIVVVRAEREGYRKLALWLIKELKDRKINIFKVPPKEPADDYWMGLWNAGFMKGDLDFLETLQKEGAKINEIISKEDNLTPIQRAACFTNPQLIKYLVLKGANVNHENSNKEGLDYFNPLSAVAVMACDDDVELKFLYKATRVLVQYGAEIDKRSQIEDLISQSIETSYDNVSKYCFGETEQENEQRETEKRDNIKQALITFNKAVADGLVLRQKQDSSKHTLSDALSYLLTVDYKAKRSDLMKSDQTASLSSFIKLMSNSQPGIATD